MPYMSLICPVYVPYMSLICPLYVPYMSLICPLYVPYMSLICPLYVAVRYLHRLSLQTITIAYYCRLLLQTITVGCDISTACSPNPLFSFKLTCAAWVRDLHSVPPPFFKKGGARCAPLKKGGARCAPLKNYCFFSPKKLPGPPGCDICTACSPNPLCPSCHAGSGD